MKLPVHCFVAVMIGCMLVSACDEQPEIVYVADSDAVQVLQLTAAQGDCAWPRRVCYLSTWNGEASRGCWSREMAYIHVRFPDQEDRLVPVSEFRATEFAIEMNVSLE